MRIFPLSNWTELDIWHYIGREGIEIPSIYFSHQRRVFERDGMLLTRVSDNPQRRGRDRRGADGAVPHRRRHDADRVCGDDGDTIDEIIEEIAIARVTERGATRGDDRFSEAAMEDRKREGYF